MKSCIVSVVVLLALWAGVTQAEDAPFGGAPQGTGPGTPTPTPYPQLTVPPTLGTGGLNRDSPTLPAIKAPSPPKDQVLPGADASSKSQDPTL